MALATKMNFNVGDFRKEGNGNRSLDSNTNFQIPISFKPDQRIPTSGCNDIGIRKLMAEYVTN